MLDKALFWNIVTVISTIIEWTVYKIVLDEFSEHRKNNTIIKSLIATLIVMTTVLTIAGVNSNVKLFIGMIGGYVFYLYNYKSTVLKSLVISLVYWMILIGVDSVSSSIILMINSIDNLNILLNNNVLRLEFIILSKILLISIIPFIKGLKLQIEFKQKEFIYIIILVVDNILSIVIIFGLTMNTTKNSLTILIASGILFMSNMSLIHIIGNIIKNNNIMMENQIVKEKIKMQYKNYLNLQEAQIKVRKLYHDMKNHITCIQNIYGYNEVAEIYIDHIKSELNEWKSIFTTGNMILDIILNDKKSFCDNNNIELIVDIKFSRCDFIDMMDICSIFSNMLDNAIEACMKIDSMEIERFIKIKGTIVNGFFVVKCENSKINEIKTKNNNIKTDKEDSDLHGIGIKSIKSSVQKYNGEVYIDYQDCKFVVKIYIPII
ncbi:GHKL domain-containing protein [Clostridioides sp. ZZV13-5731]|uniref:GHKL domain-containing protein n=3 Tax=Clostridioides TaxID=1870884 RepID=UPI001D10B452|nr:GHKL domain-containing protein [Clostridioides sp. ZZV14-6150]MCC0742776.1 GHKL domain-containing protein [Clostridioides sp. ZZV14-6044]MCC0751269.1 GHKL domain-containing protein [Clostridioides sp. ZZV13-5731]